MHDDKIPLGMNINETETQSNEKLKWVFEITTESRKPTTNQSIRSTKETEKFGPTYRNKKRRKRRMFLLSIVGLLRLEC